MPNRKEQAENSRLRLIRKGLYHSQNYLCYWCDTRCTPSRSHGGTLTPNSFTLDHIVPRGNGGTNDPYNLVGACHRCNDARNRGVVLIPKRRATPTAASTPTHSAVPNALNITPTRLGHLTILHYLGSSRWAVQCDCGVVETRKTRTLRLAPTPDDCCFDCQRVAKWIALRFWNEYGFMLQADTYHTDAVNFSLTMRRPPTTPLL